MISDKLLSTCTNVFKSVQFAIYLFSVIMSHVMIINGSKRIIFLQMFYVIQKITNIVGY